MYAGRFHLAQVYTPQLVVDGSRQMSGVNAKEIEIALQEARGRAKTELRIIAASAEQKRLGVHIESAVNLPEGVRAADLYLAVALSHAESEVAAGENARRHLTHTAVVRKLTRVAKLKAGERFSRVVESKLDDSADLSNLRVVAFLQDPVSGKVFGATMQRVESSGQSEQAGPTSSQGKQPGPGRN
jgi:hypothetical protein